jgi:YesN/AraC family two-component response regulator
VANVGENQVACVLLSQHSKLTTDVEKSLPTLQEEIRVREGGSVALVVSDAVSDVRQLSRALRNATDRARDRFFLGPDAVILGDERRRESVSVYPGKLERKLIEAVRGGDRGEIVSLVAEFMAVLRTLSYERAIAFSERLLSALVNEFRKPPTESIVPDDVFVQLRAGSYITSVEEVFLSACLTVAAELESRREVSKQDVMETVRAYVDQHFNEYQMSLEHLSTRFQMSRDHLGRRFLECFGVHFTEYVTAKRVELAKQMLCEQSESVAEIGERTGFPNRGYFATIFKRYTGHTPTSYRAHCGRSDR